MRVPTCALRRINCCLSNLCAMTNSIFKERLNLGARFFTMCLLVLLVCAKGGVRHWKCGRQALWLI